MSINLIKEIHADLPFNGGPAKFNEDVQQKFLGRTQGLEWSHLGETDLNIADLELILKRQPNLLAPRSGHIGNWSDIAMGRAGLIDYNKVVCFEKKIGYPLLYLFNQTENELMTTGDTIYLPGSLVEMGKVTPLRLYSYNGNEFVLRDRRKSYFTPFVLTEFGGELISLIDFHKLQFQKIKDFNYVGEGEITLEDEALLSRVLEYLLAVALEHPKPQEILQELFSHVVTKDGIVERCEILSVNNKIQINGHVFNSISEVVKASLWPILIATRSNEAKQLIIDAPEVMPLRGAMFTNLWSALRKFHLSKEVRQKNNLSGNFEVHFHWGAVGMAGYPPFKRGYFGNKDKMKACKWIASKIVSQFNEIDPCFFALLPVAPYFLSSSSYYGEDVMALNKLVSNVMTASSGIIGDPAKLMKVLEPVVKNWMAEAKISSYFKFKFAQRRTVASTLELPVIKSESVFPEDFQKLTMRQACVTAGLIFDHVESAKW